MCIQVGEVNMAILLLINFCGSECSTPGVLMEAEQGIGNLLRLWLRWSLDFTLGSSLET